MKKDILTIILFFGAFVWFIMFAYNITYKKDLMTWICLFNLITWLNIGFFVFKYKPINEKQK